MRKQFTIGLIMLTAGISFPLQTIKAAVEIPVTFQFTSDLEDCTVINADPSSPGFEWTRWDKVRYDGEYGDTADDWVVTPALSLEAGKIYELSYTYNAYWYGFDWNPTVTWMIGSAPTAEDLDKEIQPPLSLESSYNDASETFSFSVSADGDYYIGMHLQGEEAQRYPSFSLKEIDIKEGLAATAPGAPALTATPFIEDGELKISLTLAAPTNTLGGEAISEDMTYSIVTSNNREVATGKVAPGAEIEVVDTECYGSSETYLVTVTNAGGTSKATETKINISYDTPAPVSNVKVDVAGDNVTISWDPVTEGAKGGLFNPATVVYSVQRSDRTYLATKIKECTATDQMTIPTHGQLEVSYTVMAFPNAASYTSSSAQSEPVLLGNPYKDSFEESFAEGKISTSLWKFHPDTESYAWKTVTSCYNNPSCYEAQDKDGGFLQYTTSSFYYDRSYLSPFIDMSGAKNPVVDFYIYRYESAPEEAMVNVSILNGEKEIPLEGGELIFKAEEDGWQLIQLSIPSEVEGAFRIHFEGQTPGSSTCYALIDNLKVRDLLNKNVTIDAITAPLTAMPGETVIVEVALSNTGAEALSEIVVDLSYEGVTLKSDALTLTPGDKKTVPFNVYVSPFMTDKNVDFEAIAEVTGDENLADNDGTARMAVGSHSLPGASSLQAYHSEEGVSLRWSLPAISAEPSTENVVEGFEDWTVGDTAARNDWLFVDEDGGRRAGLAGVNQDMQYAFFVADKLTSSSMSYLEFREGENALVATRNNDYSDVNVWLISPVIDPAVPVSFYAAGIGYNNYDSASLEVGYLPGESMDIDDFVKKEDVELDRYTGWDQILLSLPSDASRFAIHVTYIGNNGVAFDEFSYGALQAPPALVSHKIWRNGALIATVAPDAEAHLDAEADRSQTNTYHLSSLYAPSREVMSPESYVLEAATPTSVAQVSKEKDFDISGRCLTAYAGCKVYTLAGTLKARLNANSEIALEEGIYLIVSDKETIKVIIK